MKLRALLITAAVAVASLGATVPAHADTASNYFNTDPYTTGCGKGAYIITSKAVPGGTAFVAFSPKCKTNWVEYSGKNQWTTKSIKRHPGWTRFEKDKAGWSYSMQVYAPGNTTVNGYISVGGKEFHVTCSTKCSWHQGLQLPG